MSRQEFNKPTKRAALKRAEGRCEAVGAMYGLATDTRCSASLAHGVNFDHVILEANSHDNCLDNCAAVCIPCHRYKTAKHDIPLAAKTVAQRDKANGIRSRRGPPLPGTKASGLRRRMDGTVERREP
jgi:5-methylcytosine-specific restriction enzyme A